MQYAELKSAKGCVRSVQDVEEFKTYPVMLEHAGELSELEKGVLAEHREWLIEVNRTGFLAFAAAIVLLRRSGCCATLAGCSQVPPAA